MEVNFIEKYIAEMSPLTGDDIRAHAELAGVEHPVVTIKTTREFLTKVLMNKYTHYWSGHDLDTPEFGFQYKTHFEKSNLNGEDGMSLVKQIEGAVYADGERKNIDSRREPLLIIPKALKYFESDCEIELYEDLDDKGKTAVVMAQLVLILWWLQNFCKHHRRAAGLFRLNIYERFLFWGYSWHRINGDLSLLGESSPAHRRSRISKMKLEKQCTVIHPRECALKLGFDLPKQPQNIAEAVQQATKQIRQHFGVRVPKHMEKDAKEEVKEDITDELTDILESINDFSALE